MVKRARGWNVRGHHHAVALATLLGSAVLVGLRVQVEVGLASRPPIAVYDVPLEYVMLAWFLALSVLRADGARTEGAAQMRVTLYEWWLAIIGLSGLIWVASQVIAAHRIEAVVWQYWCAGLSIVAIFVSGAAVDRGERIDMSHVVRGFVPDVLRILRRPVTWMCCGAAMLTVAFGPRGGTPPTEVRAFQRWYARQMSVGVPLQWQVRPVTLLKVVDYQCPASRSAAVAYERMIMEFETRHADLFAFIRVDFPLESECNALVGEEGSSGGHDAACEAAAAVRLAKAAGVDRERLVVEWLWSNQRALTPQYVLDGVEHKCGLKVRGHYDNLLAEIRADAEEVRRLGVSATPTLFLNGKRLPLLAPGLMRMAISTEIERVGRVDSNGLP